jgi:CD109 antigen
VEEYVLPKYEITVELPKEWFLINEPIKGKIKAEYSFGKPVTGELKIEALKYVGKWQTYSTFSKAIDGEVEFELPAASYVTGTPAGGGQGNIQLNVTVEEKSTGYVEKTSRLLTVAQSSMNLQLIPDSAVFKPGLPFGILVVTETPDNRPVDAKVDVTVTYSNSKFETIKTDNKLAETVKASHPWISSHPQMPLRCQSKLLK